MAALLMHTRLAVVALGAALFALGCGRVRDDIGSGGSSAGAANNTGGSEGGLDGEMRSAGGSEGGLTGETRNAGGAAGGPGGDVGRGSGGETTATDGGGIVCPGTQVEIGGKCVTLGTVTPCGSSRSSGFPGDTQCIEAPAQALGMQLHFGPKDYSDPDEVSKFVLAPAATDSKCMFMKTPNATPVHVKEWHARVRPGAYEAILFGGGTPRPDSTGPDSCLNGGSAGSAFVSVAGTDLDLSLDGGDPELKGAAMSVDAHTQVAFDVIMANISDAPILVEAWLNGLYAEEAAVTMEVAPISWLGGLAMRIPPHTNQIVQSGASPGTTSCVATADTNLLALVGSTGLYTTHMAAYLERAGTSRTRIYESFGWRPPVRLYYNGAVQNPLPAPGAHTTGGPSGILPVHAGDAISWECSIENTTDGTLTFSNNPFTGELCNFYGVYGAGTKPWDCFF
jgi:hypothetical protein